MLFPRAYSALCAHGRQPVQEGQKWGHDCIPFEIRHHQLDEDEAPNAVQCCLTSQPGTKNKPARSRRMRQPLRGRGGGGGALRGRTRDTYSGTASPWASASRGADSGCSQAAGTSVIAWPTPQGRLPHTPYCTTAAAAAPC